MDEIDQIFLAVDETRASRSPIIACLYTDARLPPHCAPMPREPEPQTGMQFDPQFASVLRSALATNASVHDGAVMIGRAKAADAYRVIGWSYRLFAPPGDFNAELNRGSAFNSSLAMSRVHAIDRVYLISGQGVFRFTQGNVEALRRAAT